MSYTMQSATDDLAQICQSFRQLDPDQQLALFYFIYKEMGHSITPAAPGASTASSTIGEGLFEQVKHLSREEQLQLQRDLIVGNNTLISREYGALSDTTKLLFWYLLAQGMDDGTVVPLPENYELTSAAQNLFGQIQALGFQQQITLFRDIVAPMGVDPSQVALDPNLNL